MNDKDIQFIMKSKEWSAVEQFLRDRFNSIKIDRSLPVAELGQRALAKIMAIEEFEKAINDMERIKNHQDKKNIKYV